MGSELWAVPPTMRTLPRLSFRGPAAPRRLGLREIPRDSFGLAHCQLIALPSGLQFFGLCLEVPFQPPM
jgi:hypothetical protein